MQYLLTEMLEKEKSRQTSSVILSYFIDVVSESKIHNHKSVLKIKQVFLMRVFRLSPCSLTLTIGINVESKAAKFAIGPDRIFRKQKFKKTLYF